MAATSAALREDPGAEALEMVEQMRALADAGDWVEVESLAVRLRGAVMQVPEARRRDVLVAVQRATKEIADKAEEARSDVTDRLSALRLGQRAAKAYEMR